MLTHLHIQNFALISKLAIEFSNQLNVFTGETGAGKSILLDALCFALGERLDSDRKLGSSETCMVEAVFEINEKKLRNHSLIHDYLAEDESVLILRREISGQGRARASVNGRTVTNATLKEIGSLLIDIHGQHDHQLLFDTATHLNLLDQFGKTESLVQKYQSVFIQYHELCTKRNELIQMQEGRERQVDLLKYQIDEIERAALKEGEEEELKHEHIRLANAEKLNELTKRITDGLNDADKSASNWFVALYRDISQLAKLDPSTEEIKSQYENVQAGLEELIRCLQDYQENLSFEDGRLDEVEKRLDQIELVLKKYGPGTAKVLKFWEEAKQKYDHLTNHNLYEKEVDQKIKHLLPQLTEAARDLTDKRKKASQTIKKVIEQELKDLSIPHVKFECQFQDKDFSLDGKDQVEFLISLNVGEVLLPLRKIISGGEASRVMLALKKALMKVDPVPTLIFDEIDANIGGRLGSVVGQKLKEITAERQVLLITHLPQIASFADRHFRVSKAVSGNKTEINYDVIEGEDRVKELAQMMSGKKETEISKRHAQEMLERVN